MSIVPALRRRQRTRGQSLVEFALVLPLLILLLLFAIDFGRVFLGWVELTNVVRIGANFAALNPQGWEGAGNPALKARYNQLIIADARATNCRLPNPAVPAPPTFPDASPNQYTIGSRAVVSLTCKFHVITPFIGGIVGDSNGDVSVSATVTFPIRGGAIAGIPVNVVVPTPTPTATPTPTPTPVPTPSPSPTLGPTPSPSPTPLPVVTISFYGTPTSLNSSGGGAPGSPGENQIVGVPATVVAFTNSTTGSQVSCLWTFGDGATQATCGNPTHSYTTRGTYNVTLAVNSQSLVRSAYVLVGCQVPDFHGVKVNNADTVWTNAGFTLANLSQQNGNGNYFINFQSISSGTLNPAGGCAGAAITVGP